MRSEAPRSGSASVRLEGDDDALLRIEDLVVRFPAGRGQLVHAVEGVDLTIGAGETLGLVGESGSGKSTIGFTALRMYAPVSGRILFDGQDITEASRAHLRELRRDMQIVFQDPNASLNSRMKVQDIVAEPLIVHRAGLDDRQLRARAGELLERCGLPAASGSRYPHAFSGGERQRIAIARAIALNPKLIVADEVVSSLDVSIQAQIINLLVELQREASVSYLFISHNLAVVRHIAHRIMLLYAGKVMEYGPTEDIFSRPVHPYTHALLSAAPMPDPSLERQRERIVLQGELPNVLEMPQGCVFKTRCPLVVDKCHTEEPPLTEHGPGRWAACWRPTEARRLPGAELASEGKRQLERSPLLAASDE